MIAGNEASLKRRREREHGTATRVRWLIGPSNGLRLNPGVIEVVNSA